MNAVLAELVAAAHRRARSLPTLSRARRERPSFVQAIAGKEELAIIAEFKRSSPSGAIAAGADLAARARTYAAAGAAALSILTEPTRFGGSFEDLQVAAETTELPLLMKDFVVSPAQVELAAHLGASAVLLIVRCLEPEALHELSAACHRAGLAPLVECHTEDEVACAAEMDCVIGVNNRDLDDLSIDRERAARLLGAVATGRVTVAESGYDEPAQARALRGRVDAALIGTALMRSSDPARFLTEVRA